MREPRFLSLIKLDPESEKEYEKLGYSMKQYPFYKEQSLIFLGEIPNMPGHCVVLGKSGKIYSGYHTDHFVELTDEEV